MYSEKYNIGFINSQTSKQFLSREPYLQSLHFHSYFLYNWKLIKVFVQTIFMLNFDSKILEEFKYTNVITLIEQSISLALEESDQNRLILECLKVCSFYSQDSTLWPQMITRAFVKALFLMLGLKDKDEKRYPLSILNDILPSPLAFRFIKELPYQDGMNKLYTLYPKDQVETLLTKIYEEHKNLQGLPVPSDFLTKHPYMKNIGVDFKENYLKKLEEQDLEGHSTLPGLARDRLKQGLRVNSKSTNKRSLNSFHPYSSNFNKGSQRISLKEIVTRSKMGQSKMSTLKPQNINYSVDAIPEESERGASFVQITKSRIESAERSAGKKSKAEENKDKLQVESYLKGLNDEEVDLNSSVERANEHRKIREKIKQPKLKLPNKNLYHTIKNLDINPDDSVSVMERPLVQAKDVSYNDTQSAISADSSIIGKVNPVMNNFYKERERIRKRQAERLKKKVL